MKNTHKSSKFIIETDVIYYSDIGKYGAGVVIINPEGVRTNRMAPSSTMYSNEKEAEEVSFEFGKELLANHLSKAESLYFY